MRARLVIRDRIQLAESLFAEIVIWEVPTPVRGSEHRYKFRLALVANSDCVLRFDNEAGKGGHIHDAGVERLYAFTSIDALIDDFWQEVSRWTNEP